jgi:hypothetical protein
VSLRNCLGEEQKTHDDVSHVRAMQGTRASADSANDAVQVDETVQVPQDFINGIEIKGIDVGVDYNSFLALAKAPN